MSADAGSAGPTKATPATQATQATQAVQATQAPRTAKAPSPPASPPTPPPPPPPTTSDRILDAALASFATRGYEATSLDALAKGLELTKQSILYWFPSKDAVLEAVIARSAADLSGPWSRPCEAPGRVGSGSRPWCARSSGWRRANPSSWGCCGKSSRLGPPGGHPDDAGAGALGAAGVILSGG